MNENNMNQGFPENPNGADGGMNDQTPENNMPYGYNADPVSYTHLRAHET